MGQSATRLQFWYARAVWSRIVRILWKQFLLWRKKTELFIIFFQRNFQSFESSVNQNVAPQSYANIPPAAYGGPFLNPASQIPNNTMYNQPDINEKPYTSEYDDEPPLLEGKWTFKLTKHFYNINIF